MTIQERLDELRREYDAGKQQLQQLQAQLLRIEGAILLAQELLKAPAEAKPAE